MAQKAEIISFEGAARRMKSKRADAQELSDQGAVTQDGVSPLDKEVPGEFVLVERYPRPTDPDALADSVFGPGYGFTPVTYKAEKAIKEDRPANIRNLPRRNV